MFTLLEGFDIKRSSLHPPLLLTLSQTTNFRLFQFERVRRRQFKIQWKWQKVLQKWVENTVGKGEIARYEQFLLFPQCFQKTCTADTEKPGLGKEINTLSSWKWTFYRFISSIKLKSFTTKTWLLTTLWKQPFENIVGKGENAGNQHFLLFPQCFLPFPKQISILHSHLFCCLQMLSIWSSLKFCSLVKS